MSKILLLFILLTVTYTQDDIFNRVLLSQDRGASCLDGSPPAIYVHEGKGANKNNFMVYFEGGGFCGEPTLDATLQSCYKRSFSKYGTSKDYPLTMNGRQYGVLSPIQQQNPHFYDWTIVVSRYCDGHQYVGHRQEPIQYKGRNLYFRGSRNVKEVFYYLSQKYDIYNGDKISIGGGSAGGICAFQWANYVAANTKKAKVFANPDAGFFMTDYLTPIYNAKIMRAHSQPLIQLVYNKTEAPEVIEKCLADNPKFDVVDCMNSGNYAKYIKVPFFMIQSAYDAFSIENIVVTKCPTNPNPPYSLQSCNASQRAAIDDYRLKSIQYLKSMRNGRKDVGIWSPACVQHSFQHITYSFNSEKYQVQGVTLSDALDRFFKDPENAPWLLDEMAWPGNAGCSGLASLRMQ